MRISDWSSDVCSSDLGTVEGNLLDARRPGLLGDGATDLGGGLDVLVALQAVADVGLRGAGRGEHLLAVGADQLRVDVLAGAQHRQARPADSADMRAVRLGAATPCVALVPLFLSVEHLTPVLPHATHNHK